MFNEGMLDNNNLYNDKELFDEGDLKWYDYGLRNYDPQTGRFPQLDPLTDEFPYYTPYQYAGNEPIANVDMDGLEPWNVLQEVIVKAAPRLAQAAKTGLSTAMVVGLVAKVGVQVAYNSLVDVARTFNTYVNPLTPLVELATGKSVESDFTEDKSRVTSGTESAMMLIPFGKVAGTVAKVAEKTVIKTVAKKATSFLKFGGDEAIEHFTRHADQIMKVTRKSAYNLKNYVDDANWIIQNGIYSSKLNGYYYYMGNAAKKGKSLFGFVGLKNGGSTISTFHIKSATELGLK